ncbi:thiamine pyrophosphate-dependent enzyme, partial [Pseudomonas aeruginosa]|uniref:thiamine pyrophosphate-dependent enzyme n=1 Tax=Pseudomonas aeruginosa TaxID=287 RepID=UPI0021F1B3EE
MSTLSTDQLLHAYRVMRTIRAFEERLHVEFATGEIPGFVHLYAGEEASAAGVMAHLRDDDCIASTHRGHGHCIAKGVDVHGMMAEIYGKKTGVCQGKGGSMHIADLEKGMLGANGIVGAPPPPGPPPPPGAQRENTGGGGGGGFGGCGGQPRAGVGGV